MEKKSIIIGAGTYGEVYASYLKEAGYEIVGFLDDDTSKHGLEYSGIKVLGSRGMLATLGTTHNVRNVFCPLGNNKLRVRFLREAEQLGYNVPCYIHQSVIVSPEVTIGKKGVYILLGAKIMPHTIIEDYVMISMGANIAHHSHLKYGTFISTGVNFGASIVAEPYSYCGISSTIMTGMHRLGTECLIGAGAVVIKDVPDGAVVAGVPAKILKYKAGYSNSSSGYPTDKSKSGGNFLIINYLAA